MWWLSFCDETRPAGEQFLGAVLVRAAGFIEAIKASHAMGINPGGEAIGHQIPREHLHLIDPKWVERILTRPECGVFDEEMQRKLAQ